MGACKREQAIRAKDLALQKMSARDFQSARKLAARARHLCPDLDGLNPISLVCSVHCSADASRAADDDELDWYKILLVGPTADEAAVRRQYRRMALCLRQDKNGLPGADEAFGLVRRARAVLADTEERKAYDGRRKNASLSGSRLQGNGAEDNRFGFSGFRSGYRDNNSPASLEKSSNVLSFSGSQNDMPKYSGFSGFRCDNRVFPEKCNKDSGFTAFKDDNISFSKFEEMGFVRFKDSGLSGFHIRPDPSPDQGFTRRSITKENNLPVNGIKPFGFAAVQGNVLKKFGPKPHSKVTKLKRQNKKKTAVKVGEKGSSRVEKLPVDLKKLEYSDSELNDFEKGRAKRNFGPGQIWALYDTLDAMPRFYALINKVISDDFKVEVTWLEPCPNNEDEKKWLHNGLPASCGKFRPGASEIIEDHAVFSHLVKWKKDIRNIYHVHPKKGETWAMFKNWSLEWRLNPGNHIKRFEFDFVEILSEYRAGFGAKVAFLGKIKGFSTLFCRMSEKRVVPVNDRLRFSHRVSSFKMTSSTGLNGDSSSFELDPASLPVGFGCSEISSISGIFM
ncbi:DNAJ heat shock N-terminal domain-containing protein [Striga hermonthica]|uniref:DNAJ heat shock N-terminal domain-containing protein n=1 Tax=Striga hermonthica TaxID=68872 RepID=A0A9N7NQB7_STRHE|nr:DNAJ heat shock N-terminal domain-containing protein [Striga hermonthica]